MSYAKELAKMEKRNQKILKLRAGGMSQEKIGEQFGISRQRVAEIIKKAMK